MCCGWISSRSRSTGETIPSSVFHCVMSRSSCCLYINQHFTRGCSVRQLGRSSPSKPTHTTNTTKSRLRRATSSTTAAPHLALLGLFLSLGLSAPSAAPLLQRLLGLRRQAARQRRRPVQALDQTQAGVHAGQVVPACVQNIQDGITSGSVRSVRVRVSRCRKIKLFIVLSRRLR